MACKTIQRVFVPSLKLLGPTNTELKAKGVGEFSIVIWENELMGILLFTNVAAAIYMHGDFPNFELRNSCIYWYIDLKLAETFHNRVINIVYKFCQKSR